MRAALILALALVAAPALAQDIEAGKAKAAQVCGACHGPKGDHPSAPDQPILAGQYDDYLVKVLHDYKSGKRKNPIMGVFAKQLSDQDIENVAAWFSSQPSPLHSKR